MEDRESLRLRLHELEDLRNKTLETIPNIHGSVKQELRRMLDGLEAEIAELRSRIEQAG